MIVARRGMSILENIREDIGIYCRYGVPDQPNPQPYSTMQTSLSERRSHLQTVSPNPLISTIASQNVLDVFLT